jgi:uncharacterized protein YgbK (DUF1537 family)
LTKTYEWDGRTVDPAEPRRIAGVRQTIRESNRRTGRRLLVLDDDPTGSQAVHGVSAVTTPDLEVILEALEAPGSTCFVLTNSRSLPETEAIQRAHDLAIMAIELEKRLGGIVEVISRSDSTLRGHVMPEISELVATRRESGGRGYDGVLLIPSYLEAGRFTASNIHWARVGNDVVAVGETEFARDATFSYQNSDLRSFLEEKSNGAIAASDVHAISLADIRRGGPDRVAEILLDVRDGEFVVVNCVDYADLEVVVLGLLSVEGKGRAFLYRTGPSFVQVLAGLDVIAPLDAASIWPEQPPAGHGLVVVGSHVGLTNRQVEVLLARGGIERIVVDADSLLDPSQAAAAIRSCILAARQALGEHDVLLITSRTLLVGTSGDESLGIARAVSAGVVAIVGALLSERPAWVISKGGITSHDVLVNALGVRRAEVIGQLFAGFVSVFRAVESRPEALGMPCIVFAGNVGGDNSLADAVDILRGR